MAKKTKKDAQPEEKAGISFDNITQVKDMLSGMSLTLGGFGILKQVEKAENLLAAQALEAEEGNIKTTRLLIDRNLEEYKDVQRTKTAARAWFYSVTLPYPIDKIRLFRKDQRDEIMARIVEWREALNEGARRLTKKRAQILEWARKGLGKAFDANLYPADFATLYTIQPHEHNIEPPSYLAASNAEEYKQELASRMVALQEGMKTYQKQCMAQLSQSAGNLLVSISNDGKRVESSNLEQMRKVFSRVAAMNFEGTAMFKQAMTDYKDAIDGVGTAELRRPGGVREETREKLTALMDRYKALQSENLAAMRS